MLVLSRKEGQRIRLGDDTTITITRIKGNLVRIGIEAPEHVTVLRAELLDGDEVEMEPAFQAERVSSRGSSLRRTSLPRVGAPR